MMGEAEGDDKSLTCVDCGVQFTFTARDQAFYQERGFQPPRRCKTCRDKRKGGGGGGDAGGGGGGNRGGHARSTPAGGMSSPRDHGHGGGGGAGAGDEKEHFKVQCSGCGTETTVPFKPDPNRPVFCRACYLSRKKT